MTRPPAHRLWTARGRVLVSGSRPRIMGIVNVTPDSFSDGGLALDPGSALDRARKLAAEGADILDLGGESSRPGAEVVPLAEELRRVIPAVEAIAGELDVPLSIDTVKPEVARQAIARGASILNDISGLSDPAMVRLAAETGVGVVVMHMLGDPRTMQDDPRYDDVIEAVRSFLARRLDEAEKAGIPRERIALDPGIGFGKTSEHNLLLLRHVGRFATLGCVVLVGVSRKGFLGEITGRPRNDRAVATASASLAAIVGGAAVARVHDVAAMADTLKVWEAVHGWESHP